MILFLRLFLSILTVIHFHLLELINELHTACRDNRLDTVKRIVDQNPDIINVAIDPNKVP